MGDVTQMLEAIERGERKAAVELLPRWSMTNSAGWPAGNSPRSVRARPFKPPP
jgi:hypothetical protein